MTGTAIPETAEELEECLSDDARMGAIFAEGKLAEFNRQYMAKALNKKAADLVPQMREQMQLGWQEFLRDQEAKGNRPWNGGGGWQGWPGAPGLGIPGWPPVTDSSRDARALRAVARSRRPDAAWQADKQRLFNPRALGAKVDDEPYAGSLGEFSYAVYSAERNATKKGDTKEVERLQDFKRKLANALVERIPSEGGFLVPENLRSEILMVALESAVVRPRARIIPMDSLRVPLPAIDDTSHASSVFGGVIGYWTEEGAALTASAPSFARVVLEAKKLTAYTTIPNELLQDAVTPLDTWFNSFFPQAISWFEDVAFLTGTGVGQPQGILNAPGAVTVSRGTQYHIKFNDIAKAYSRMWPASLNRAVWLCSPDVLVELLQLALSEDGSGTTVAPPLWLQSYSAADGTPGSGTGDGRNYMLMGRPLVVSEKLPSNTSGNTTTAGALTFVDFDYYLLGDRQTMQVASSEEYLFANDLVAYRVIERLDGRFWLQSPITPEGGGASTLSPLVLIDTH
ncbi:MAG TPA: phage major capsid protein [Streptosporangiaceae bacterium]|nr:phage major capsid protein [Streptosporangiaceae bacterium]